MTNMKLSSNLKFNFKKIFKFILLIGSILLIIGGFLLNFKLLFAVDKNSETSLITNEERQYLNNISSGEYETGEVLRDEYLKRLSKLEKQYKRPTKGEEIAKVYYILALNEYMEDNNLEAIEYYKKAIDNFKNGNNHYYMLKSHNSLMNLYFNQNDQISALKHANEIYAILSRPNIHDISEEEQISLRMNILSGIVTTTSTYEITEVGKKFYDELVRITEANPEIVSNINIYAKYQYNLNIGNYDEAKKFAIEYINHFKETNIDGVDGAKVYLLEALIYKGEFEGIEDVFSSVEKAYLELNQPMYTATLDKLKGYYCEAIGQYEEGIVYLEKSIELYESLGMITHATEVNNRIIGLYDDMDIDINKYMERAERYGNITNVKKEIGELANSLIEVSLKKSDDENAKIKEEVKFTESLNSMSKKLNIIYIAVIILLILISKLLLSEVRDRKEKEKQLENMIKVDYLTKAFSKQHTFRKIQKLMDKREKFSIVLFDIDNFKNINDTYGHPFGDDILINVVKGIRNAFGPETFIGRFGGEEFIIILDENVNLNSTPSKIKSALSTLKWNDKDLQVTVSGGLKTWTGESINKLICEADILLYQGKAEGKDRIISKIEF